MTSQPKKSQLWTMHFIAACTVMVTNAATEPVAPTGGVLAVTEKEQVSTDPTALDANDLANDVPVVEYMDAVSTDDQTGPASLSGQDAPPPVKAPAFPGTIPLARNPVANNRPTVDQSSKGCIDILMSGQIYADPSVNVVYAYVYSLCLMEWTMQKYLKSQKYMQVQDHAVVASTEASLSDVQRILPSYLMAFFMLIDAFKQDTFRKELDILRKRGNDRDNGVNLRVPAL